MTKTEILRNGQKMPMVGFGTAFLSDTSKAVKTAIDAGYRHFDCAFVYNNEDEIGDAIQNKIKDGTVKRGDLFVTSKVWCTHFSPNRPNRVQESIEKTLDNLKLDYVDLYLIHQPFAFEFTEEGAFLPTNESGELLLDESIDYVDVWKEMEKLQKAGLAKAIGISNFNQFQIKRIIDQGRIVPAVHRYECHPYAQQEEMLQFCKSNDIVTVGYGSFGSPSRPWAKQDDPSLFEEPVLKQIADKYGKTVAQIILRYQIQRGIVVIPSSSNPSQIFSNFKVFDFNINEDDKMLIMKLDRNLQFFPGLAPSHKYYPHKENYSE